MDYSGQDVYLRPASSFTSNDSREEKKELSSFFHLEQSGTRTFRSIYNKSSSFDLSVSELALILRVLSFEFFFYLTWILKKGILSLD